MVIVRSQSLEPSSKTPGRIINRYQQLEGVVVGGNDECLSIDVWTVSSNTSHDGQVFMLCGRVVVLPLG